MRLDNYLTLIVNPSQTGFRPVFEGRDGPIVSARVKGTTQEAMACTHREGHRNIGYLPVSTFDRQAKVIATAIGVATDTQRALTASLIDALVKAVIFRTAGAAPTTQESNDDE